MSLDELFKTMHSDFKDFTSEADKLISNYKQTEMEQIKIKPRSKYVISGYTLENMIDLAVRLGRIDEKFDPEDVSDQAFDATMKNAMKTGKNDYFKLLEE